MAANNDSKHNRVLEITLVGDESSDDVLVTGINFRRDGFGGTAIAVGNTPGARATTHDVAFSESIPQGVTHLRFIFTQQA